MEELSILYDQNIDYKTIMDYAYLEARRNSIRGYSTACQASLLLVDHFKRNSYFYHNNPDCYSLFGKSFSQERVPDNFLESFISKEDEKLFATIITAIKDSMRNDFLKGDKHYYFSFDLSLHGHRLKAGRYSFIVFPYLYSPDNKLWVTAYQITASSCADSGNLRLHAIKEGTCYGFDMESGTFYKEGVTWKLS